MSAYAFTATEKALLDTAAGDAAKLQALLDSKQLTLAAVIADTAERSAAKSAPKDALAIVELADGGHITFKISDKKAISAYGVGGKWPVTLYAAGWQRLLEALGKTNLPALIETNRDKLAWKVKEDEKA